MQFNPYHRWLGIRDEEQPPNHYRLLGLELYEADTDVIATAADRQMAHVRRYQNGPHSELSQRVLNELAVAKLCLLDAERRSNYDQRLRNQAQSHNYSSPPTSAKTKTVKPDEGRAGEPDTGATEEPVTHVTDQESNLPTPNVSPIAWGLAAAAIGMVAIGITLWPKPEPANTSLANQPNFATPANDVFTTTAPPGPPTSANTLGDETAAASAPPEIVDAEQYERPGAPTKVNADVPTEPTSNLSSSDSPAHANTGAEEMEATEVTTADTTPQVLSAQRDTDESAKKRELAGSGPVDTGPQDVKIVAPPVAAPRLAVPNDQDLDRTRKQFLRAYQPQIDEAMESDSVELSLQLVEELHGKALEMTGKPNAQYVALLESTNLAIHCGQPQLFDHCIQQITERFAVDPTTVRLLAAEQSAKTIPRLGRKLMPTAASRYCMSVLPSVRLALQNNAFDEARKIVSLLEVNAKRSRRVAPDLQSQVDLVCELSKTWQAAFEEAESAKAQLADLDPADKRSNLSRIELNWTIAKYLTFSNGDALAALPYLEQIEHASLIRIGVLEKELAQNDDADGERMLELAILWSDASTNNQFLGDGTLSREEQRTAAAKATEWCERAMPLLSLDRRADAESMLEKLRGPETGNGKLVPEHAVEFDGRRGYAVAPRFRYDGQMPLVIEALVRSNSPTASYATQGTIVSNRQGRNGFSLLAESGFWTFRFATTDEPDLYVRLASRLVPDTWTRLIATYDGEQITIQQGESPPIVDLTTAPHASSMSALGIGAGGGNNSPIGLFRGEIAELKIYGDLARTKPLFEMRLSAKKSKQQMPYNLKAY